ncbi:MAG: Gfo/Idh/MocA family oxidoreductase [Clostridia bacterium]|nr:Gfo/Idh/MocA family oxidoreductase [Clostridia bacterium]
MKKLRIGVVGLGHRGRAMFRLAGDKFDYVEPAAACDLFAHNFYEQQWRCDKSIAEAYPDCVFYEKYDDMLEKAALDAVIVETGADVHADFCIKALEKNISVLTDIPVVASLDEADRLWKAAQKSTAMISVGANPNEQKFTVMLKEFYKNGYLGEPYCMEAEYIHWSRPGSTERVKLNENGNWRKLLCPIRYCTHSLGPLLAVLKEDLRLVCCMGTGQHGPREDYEEGIVKDDMSCAQFQTESGVVVRLLRNGRCRANIGHHNYRVFGTQGYIERIERNEKPVIRYNSDLDNPELREIGGEFMPPAYANNPDAIGHGGMDYAMMDKFLRALRDGTEAPISLREGLAMTLPGIYAEESSKRGGALMKMYYPWDKEWKTVFD